MERARKDQFKSRFDKYYSMLCNVAFGFITNKEDCEDIVQETFIAVWNKEKDVLPDKEFTAYMVSSVRNKCISFLRKNKLNTVSMEEVILTPDKLYMDETEKEKKDKQYQILDEALALLPHKCKEVFLMSKIKGMKYKEIARVEGISEKTVESQMCKAVRILREYVTTHPITIIVLSLISTYNEL